MSQGNDTNPKSGADDKAPASRQEADKSFTDYFDNLGEYIPLGEASGPSAEFYEAMENISKQGTKSDGIFSEEAKKQSDNSHEFFSKAYDRAESADERARIREEYREEQREARKSTKLRALLSTQLKTVTAQGAVAVASGLAVMLIRNRLK